MKTSNYKTAQSPRLKRLTKYFCIIVVLCFINLIAIKAQDQVNQTTAVNIQPVPTKVDTVEQANIDLQNQLQKQQQIVQMISNLSKILHDTALAVIRKIG